MKEKLIKRLQEINEMVAKKKAEAAQVNADLNMFIGHQNECAGLIGAWDELNKVEINPPCTAPVPCSDDICSEVHGEVV